MPAPARRRFLGYEITVQHDDSKQHQRPPVRSTAMIALRVPTDGDQGQDAPPTCKRGKPARRTRL